MSAPAGRRLSFVVLADRFATIARVVEHLQAQTIAPELELVVACPSVDGFGPLPDGIATTLVEVPLLPMGHARAAAVRAARAPVVVLGETHVFPAPDWAERLVAAHAAGYVGGAPGLVNANPRGSLSWAGFLMDYARWVAELPRPELASPPAYNGFWDRSALDAAGASLEELLDPCTLVGPAAHVRGRFVHLPDARLAHLNVSRPGPWIGERYIGGRLLGATRSRRWSVARRILYAGGSPLIPLLRTARTLEAWRRCGRSAPLPRGTLAAVALGSTFWALGEAVGYLRGAGDAEARMLEYELYKERFV
ncbi:MAG: hypothetical protein QOE29_1966 [Gaiellaceae bacterium]|nr:hypothetical protein [Gaiellaceae bacterium]